MSTCNRLDLQTLGSHPVMPKNLPNHCPRPPDFSLSAKYRSEQHNTAFTPSTLIQSRAQLANLGHGMVSKSRGSKLQTLALVSRDEARMQDLLKCRSGPCDWLALVVATRDRGVALMKTDCKIDESGEAFEDGTKTILYCSLFGR